MEFENVTGNDGAEEVVEPNPIVEDDNGLSGEEELIKALESLKDSDDEDDDDEEIDSESDEEDEEETAADDEEDELDEEDEEEEVVEPEKQKKQSKEENAKFAAQRRQAELDRKVQEKLDELKQQSPEFKLAQELAEMYGTTPDQMLEQMREAKIQKEAKDTGKSVEDIREKQEQNSKITSLQQEINEMRYQQWQTRITNEGVALKKDYPMLSEEDMDSAVNYILKEARNVEMPLEQAVYALHGKKIIDALAKAKTQDNLAAESGRKKKTALPPNNGKPSKESKSLTAEEKYIAKQLNMTEDDYLKYK
jgi:hypothetical protein